MNTEEPKEASIRQRCYAIRRKIEAEGEYEPLPIPTSHRVLKGKGGATDGKRKKAFAKTLRIPKRKAPTADASQQEGQGQMFDKK